MFPTQRSRSPQGAFCNPVPRQTCIFTTGLLTVRRWLVWQLDRPFLVCPSDTLELSLELLSKTSMSGRMGVLWRRNRTWPVLRWQGCYHFSLSHLLKIAPTFHQQRQSRQDMARAFIFKYSLLPSKSSNRLGDILMTKIILHMLSSSVCPLFPVLV